jgi:hypothetical protein
MVKRVMQSGLVGVFAMVAVNAGCSEKSERLNAPPQGTTERPSPMQKHFNPMVDNAMKRDRSIADVHFEPQVAELSGLGVWRIARVADVLSATGGSIRYETALRDQDLIDARLQSVRDFLAASGYDTDRIKVESGLSPNSTATAASAMEAHEHWKESGSESSDSGSDQSTPMAGPQ